MHTINLNLPQKSACKVIDAITGAGKTSSIFKYMKQHPEKKYLYISILLTEVGCKDEGIKGRIQNELPELNFKTLGGCGSKSSQIKEYIKQGYNVAATHALFHKLDLETVTDLLAHNYCLVIDEAINAIDRYQYNSSDVKMMLKAGMLLLDDTSRKLTWNEEEYPNYTGVHSKIKNYCDLGNLVYYKDNILLWEYSPKLLAGLTEVIIITYQFASSIMRYWLDKNNIPWVFVPHSQLGLKPESEIKEIIRDNLEIIDLYTVKRYRNMREDGEGSMFTYTWHQALAEEDPKQMLPNLKKILESTVKMYKKKGDKVFWTTYLATKPHLEGKGYSRTPKEGLPPFLPYNKKATNEYMYHSLCLYCVNIHKSNIEVGYLKDRGIKFDQDAYALSEMIQFIFRGSIRRGDKMRVLVMSERMEKLLREWLNNG